MKYFAMSPGIGNVRGATRKLALEAFELFAREVGASKYETKKKLADDGRLDGTLWVGRRKVTLCMPGVSMAVLQSEDVFVQPRLFVNGNSYYWNFALDVARSYA